MSSEQPASQPRPWDGIVSRLEQLGHARDGLLVAIAVDYILGFLSWAFYSFKENIGFIRIFDAQYLIGGILPSLSLVVVATGWWMWRIIPAYLRTAAAVLVYLLYFGALVMTVFTGNDDQPLHVDTWFWHGQSELTKANIVFVVGLVLTPLLLIGLREARIAHWTAPRLLLRFLPKTPLDLFFQFLFTYRMLIILFGYLFSVVMTVIMLFLYFVVIYPALPQELGGPRPRCANVIVEGRQFSPELLRDIGVAPVDGHPAKPVFDRLLAGKAETVVMAKARVLYNDDKVVILKPGGDPNGPLVEIRKDLVKALVWCRE